MTALHAAGGGLPLALHIPHVVEQAGSIAGFAAVLGPAILSALYFSQARDLRRLREWAGRAPERAAEGQPAATVPGRVVAVPQRPAPGAPGQPVQGPAPARPAAAGAATPANGEKAAEGEAAKDGAEAEKPAAAAASNGDSAPAVTAADGVKTSQGEGDEAKAEDGKPAAKPGMPAPASAAAAAGTGTKSVTAPADAGAPASGPNAPGAAGVAAGGAAAGAAAASGSTAAPPKPGGPQAPGQGDAAGPKAPAPGGAGPGAPQRPPGSVLPPRTGTLPPVRRLPSSNVGPNPAQTGVIGSAPQKKKRNPVYVVLAVAGVLVLGAAAAIGVPALVNGSKDDNSSTTTAKKKATSTTSSKAKAAPTAPDKITVAVLNGTTIPGLAAQVGDRVDAEGFTLGTVSNASQTQGQRANSVAMYATGHKRDAEQVAKQLGIGSVTRIDSGSQQIAGDASVVVIVGTDKTQ
jgi:LytR cell envelope-related transcriptional attenuator